ncbi:MAG: hypothetical protein AAFV90_07890 [Cyanobacteria bacterium J06634_5]
MKVLLAGLAIVAAAVGGGLGYASMQTAGVPEWYGQSSSQTAQTPTSKTAPPQDSEVLTKKDSQSNAAPYEQATESPIESPTESTSENGASVSGDDIVVTPRADLGSETNTHSGTSLRTQGKDVVISEGELTQMVTAAITAQPQMAPILEATQGVSTQIKDGRVESGIVMNLSTLPTEALPIEGQEAVEQLRSTFPFLTNRDVYLGIEGSPTIVDGGFSLNDTNIKLGQLKLPVANVASQIGISQSDIEKQIALLLEQQGLTPEDVQIVDGQIVIRGAAQ